MRFLKPSEVVFAEDKVEKEFNELKDNEEMEKISEKIIARGAEAVITEHKNIIIKERIKKSYRLKEIDDKLRKTRTKKEANLLEKACRVTATPHVISQDKFKIEMEMIKGDKLSDKLNSYPEEKQLKLMEQLGEQVFKLHENDIIHGDLTTSNMILKEKDIFLIDFGLGFISKRDEDKAVDIHLLKQALEAKHFENFQELFNSFVKGYKNKIVLERLKIVESRGRYKE